MNALSQSSLSPDQVRPAAANRPSLYQVCWTSVIEDRSGHGKPMPRHLAEFIAEDESRGNPLRRYWIEPCKSQ